LKALPRLTELQAQLNAWPTFTDEMKRLRGGPLLDLLFKKMQAKAGLLLASLDDGAVFAGGKNSKILLYSAHDSTLSRIMNTLGIFFPHNPPYAAALIFELHLNESTKSHYVKVGKLIYALELFLLIKQDDDNPPFKFVVCSTFFRIDFLQK